jgi:hypothetical protein
VCSGLGDGGNRAAAALATGPTPADMEAAHGKTAAKVRDDILATVPPGTSATARDSWAKEKCDDFTPVLLSKSADARLNTAILISQFQTLSSDKTLMDMLANPDPTVRYWAAKGLSGKDLVPLEKAALAAGAGRVVTALRAAAKVEKVGQVEQEIVKALAVYEDVTGVLDGTESLTAQMPGTISEIGTLDAVTAGLDALAKSARSAASTDKVRAATIASQAASYAAQQQVALKLQQDAISAALPTGYPQAVSRLVDTAIKVINAASGGSFRVATNVSPDEILFNLGGITGSASSGPGGLQKIMKDVPVPATIKTGADIPGAATKSATAPH